MTTASCFMTPGTCLVQWGPPEKEISKTPDHPLESFRRMYISAYGIFSVHSGTGARERHDMSKEYCVREIPQRKHRTPRELVMGREIFNENFRSHSQVDRAPQSGRGVWVRTDDSHESVRIWTTRTHTSRTSGKARHQLGHRPSSVHLPTFSCERYDSALAVACLTQVQFRAESAAARTCGGSVASRCHQF